MAHFPQLDGVIDRFSQSVTLRRLSYTTSEYGSPSSTAQDWETEGALSNVAAEDEQLFQGLISAHVKKLYLRADAQASYAGQQKTIKQLGPRSDDRYVVSGVEYMTVAVRDYANLNGFYVVLLREVEAGG